MNDDDSGRGNTYEFDPDEFRTDVDVDIGNTVPLDDEVPGGDGQIRLPNAESAVVPTAENTEADPEGAADFETDDEVTPEAESRSVPAGAETRTPSPKRQHRPDDRRDTDLPIEGYRHLTVPEIIERVLAMPIEEARAVQRYEGCHLRRKTLMVKLERYLRGK